MTSITHPEAQSLLQAAADNSLVPLDETNLKNHLAECEECRQYAKGLAKLQDDLRRITRHRWDQVSVQISAKEIKNRSVKVEARAHNLQTIGKFAVATAVFLLVCILAINVSSRMNSILAAPGNTSLTPEEPIFTPTPSIKETATDFAIHGCNDIAYIVQENDTLENIAARHSVSIGTIKERNGLATNDLTVKMVLIIPLCERTPANSTMTPTVTSTAAP
jgi:LysM repeat protein